MLAKVTFAGNALKEGIAAVLKLAAPYTGTVNITITQDEFLIESRAELNIAFVKIPTESIELQEEVVRFGIMIEQLRLAIGNKKDKITLSLENVVLKIAAKNYRSELTTIDYIEYPKVAKQDSETLVITKEQSEWLKSTANSVALKPNLISPIMPVTVHADNSGITVACYARDHIVFTQSDKITGKIDFSIPIESFAAIFSVFGKDEFKLMASESYVHAKNDLYEVYISLPATDAYLPVDVLLTRLTAFKESNGSDVIINYKELTEFFSNIKAVMMTERPEVGITTSKGKAIFSCKTSLGNVQFACVNETDDAIDIKLDAEYLKEAVSKTDKKDVKIKCCQNDGFVLIPLKDESCSVIALNS